MTSVIVSGAAGHMGSITVNLVEAAENMTLAAAVDAFSQGGTILRSLDEFTGKADVVVDFSHHTAAPAVMDWAVRTGAAVVMATTGHDEAERECIEKAAEKIPVFFSANMSMGIALLADMAKKAASVFPDADIEIVEQHHNRKIDAPSGTALMLADSICEVRPEARLVKGRSGMEKRQPGDIGIHSLRMGNIAGVHQIIINTGSQSLTLTHEVYDRSLFAEGALTAAEFVAGKPAGLYGMKDLIANK